MYNLLVILTFVFVVSSQPVLSGERLAGPYQAKVIEVIDGDTFRASVKVWLGQDIEMLVRVDGIDTPELHGKCRQEKDMAFQAKEQLQDLIGTKEISLHDIRYGKYAGRVVARVTTDNDRDISRFLLAKNIARPYQGKKRASWC